MQVLVVDDEMQAAILATVILEGLGHEVVVAGCGDHALEAVQEGRFDLLMTSLTMSGMGGLELIGQVRRVRPVLPVIASTRHRLNRQEQARLAMIGPPVVLLEKPWYGAALTLAVRSIGGFHKYRPHSKLAPKQGCWLAS